MISKVHPSIQRTQKIAAKFNKKLAQQASPIDFSGLGNARKPLDMKQSPADLLNQLQASLSNIQATNGGAFSAASLNPNVIYSAANIAKSLKSLNLDENQKTNADVLVEKFFQTLPSPANGYFMDVMNGKVLDAPKEGFSLAAYKSTESEVRPSVAKSAPVTEKGPSASTGTVSKAKAFQEIQMAENVLRSLGPELKNLTDAGNFTAKTKRLYQLDVYRLRPMAELYKQVVNDPSMADVKARLDKFFGEQFTNTIDDHDRQTLYNSDPELLDVMGKVSGRTASRADNLIALATKIDKKY